jgi:hypothetical protein
VATKIYNAAETKIGDKLIKGAVQSKDAEGFWSSRSLEQRYSEDQPRDDHGRFASGGGESTQELPEEVKLADELQAKMRELANEAAALETSGNPAAHFNRLNEIAVQHQTLYQRVKELKESKALQRVAGAAGAATHGGAQGSRRKGSRTRCGGTKLRACDRAEQGRGSLS